MAASCPLSGVKLTHCAQVNFVDHDPSLTSQAMLLCKARTPSTRAKALPAAAWGPSWSPLQSFPLLHDLFDLSVVNVSACSQGQRTGEAKKFVKRGKALPRIKLHAASAV